MGLCNNFPQYGKTKSLNSPLKMLAHFNSWCCCKETPSTTEQSLDFLPTLHLGNQQCCLHENSIMQYDRETWCNHMCSACHKHVFFINACVLYNICLTTYARQTDNIRQTELSCKLCWFSGFAGKRIKNFVQSLVAITYSNICIPDVKKLLIKNKSGPWKKNEGPHFLIPGLRTVPLTFLILDCKLTSAPGAVVPFPACITFLRSSQVSHPCVCPRRTWELVISDGPIGAIVTCMKTTVS